VTTLRSTNPGHIFSLAFSHDNQLLVAGGEAGVVQLWGQLPPATSVTAVTDPPPPELNEPSVCSTFLLDSEDEADG
jgi:hypothetical protein